MSPARRAALFTLASVHVVLCSGTAYGWTAIRPVLKDAGVFASSTELQQARKVSCRIAQELDDGSTEPNSTLPLSLRPLSLSL